MPNIKCPLCGHLMQFAQVDIMGEDRRYAVSLTRTAHEQNNKMHYKCLCSNVELTFDSTQLSYVNADNHLYYGQLYLS